MKNLRINFFDNNISHAKSYNDSLEKGRKNTYITYEKNKYNNYKGVTIFTDNFLSYSNQIISKYKVAWIMEPFAISNNPYKYILKNFNDFDLILTHNIKIINNCKNAVFIPADGIFLDRESIFNESIKNKNLSHIYSNKKFLKGHRFRHTIADELKNYPDIDSYGSGCNNFIQKKSDSLRNYRFSIAVENNIEENYFTEKIIDCFATKTVPIYNGAPNISQFFNENSIIKFNNINELKEIVENINKDLYNSMIDSIEENYKKSLEYFDIEKIVYEKIKKGLNI
jgi:hypothetical protein